MIYTLLSLSLLSSWTNRQPPPKRNGPRNASRHCNAATVMRQSVPRYARRFVVRRDWNFAKGGKLAAIFQKLYRSEDPAKRSSQTEGNVRLTVHP